VGELRDTPYILTDVEEEPTAGLSLKTESIGLPSIEDSGLPKDCWWRV
jgi:hypothetical protein